MLAHTNKPRTQEAEAGRSGVKSCPWLHREFEASLGYMRACFKTKTVVIFEWVVLVKGVGGKIKPFTRINKNLLGEVLLINVKLS